MLRRSAATILSLFALMCSAPATLPDEAPSITGVITSMSGDRIVVEENPNDRAGSAKAAVRLTAQTRIARAGGATASRENLTTGQRVSVWFTGPVAESYPVQATASAIRIE